MATSTQTSKLRLLILSSSTTGTKQPSITSPFPSLLEYLTETPPPDSLSSFSGYTSHPPLHLKTKYYDANVTIWCDELPPPPTTTRAKNDLSNGFSYPSVENTDYTDPGDDNEGDEDDEEDEEQDLAQWKSAMLSPPALEVRSVIGGIILILPITPQQLLLLQRTKASSSSSSTTTTTTSPLEDWFAEYVRTVHSLRERIEDESITARDVASIVVLQLSGGGGSSSSLPDPEMIISPQQQQQQQLKELAGKMESWCHDEGMFGLDFVYWDGLLPSSRQETTTTVVVEKNEFGEKVGIHRVKEVLEGIDWTDNPEAELEEDSSDGNNAFINGGGNNNNNNNGLDLELQQEMMGLKLSMLDFKEGQEHDDGDDGEDMSPSEMQELMERVVAIRDAGANLPKEERQAFANREVEKIMRELM